MIIVILDWVVVKKRRALCGIVYGLRGQLVYLGRDTIELTQLVFHGAIDYPMEYEFP